MRVCGRGLRPSGRLVTATSCDQWLLQTSLFSSFLRFFLHSCSSFVSLPLFNFLSYFHLVSFYLSCSVLILCILCIPLSLPPSSSSSSCPNIHSFTSSSLVHSLLSVVSTSTPMCHFPLLVSLASGSSQLVSLISPPRSANAMRRFVAATNELHIKRVVLLIINVVKGQKVAATVMLCCKRNGW